MSKNFEQAYKELAQNEVPDLWNRIEAGIESKSALEDESIPEDSDRQDFPDGGICLLKEELEEIKLQEIEEDARAKKKGLFYSRRYAGMAAAVLCAAVIIPAVVVLNHYTGSLLSKNMAGSGQATEGINTEEEEASDTAAVVTETEEDAEETSEESAPAEAAGGVEGIAADEEGGMQDAGADSADEETEDRTSGSQSSNALRTESAADEDMADTEADTAVTEAAEKETVREEGGGQISGSGTADKEAAKTERDDRVSDLAEAQKKLEGKKIADETVFEHVMISVEKMESITSDEGPGSLCTAVVEKGPLELLGNGGMLEIYLPAYSSIALSEDGVFEVDLIYHSDREYSYTIQKYHQKIEKQ